MHLASKFQQNHWYYNKKNKDKFDLVTVGQCSWSWSSVILDKLELEDLIETSNIIEQAVLYFNLEMSTSSDC